MPAQLHFSYGVQMVCMNYANNDSNMEFYRTKFNDARSAFVLKPDNLRYKNKIAHKNINFLNNIPK